MITLRPSLDETNDLGIHIYNADGSVAQMCGNGLRCVVALVGGEHLRVETDAGLREGWNLPDGRVRVTLGRPQVAEALEIEVQGQRVRGLVVSMGNPHFVLEMFPAEADLMEQARRLGPGLEGAPEFPERTNVEFVAPRGDRFDAVVYERGVGITQACGTGAGAILAALRQRGEVDADEIVVRLPGGDLQVGLTSGVVTLTGDAVRVFEGETSLR